MYLAPCHPGAETPAYTKYLYDGLDLLTAILHPDGTAGDDGDNDWVALGACPSNVQFLLAREGRVGFCVCA